MSLDTIFINLPVKELQKSVAFYTKLGFTPHPVFVGEHVVCMCLTEHINLVLQTPSNLQQFTSKPVIDPSTSLGVMLCLHCDSPAHVDELVSKAVAAGGAVTDKAEDMGFLYTHGFTDPEGYVWKMNHVYPNAEISH